MYYEFILKDSIIPSNDVNDLNNVVWQATYMLIGLITCLSF